MHKVIRSGELQPSPGGTIRFEGESYGSGVSFFHVNNEPGKGPDLHRHPYSETWIIRAGKARITADEEDIEVGPGDIVVASAETPHKFKNIGTGRLEILCIHDSPRIIQEDLEDPGQESDFPHTLAQPAQRALSAAGVTRLEQLAETSKAKPKQLQGPVR